MSKRVRGGEHNKPTQTHNQETNMPLKTLLTQVGPIIKALLPSILSQMQKKGRPAMAKARKGNKSARTHAAKGVSKAMRGPRRKVARGRMSKASMSENSQETSFATPASFALIQNNTTAMLPESPTTHPRLGVAGVRVHGRQPFAIISPGQFGASTTFFDAASTANISGSSDQLIDLNPLNLNGPLAVRAQLYEKYAFHKVRIIATTQQTTTFVGAAALCVVDDPAIAASLVVNFNAAREVTPSVMFPYRIPQAALEWDYKGDELFFVNPSSTPGTNSDLRLNVQAVLFGFDGGSLALATPTATMFVDIEYVIDFYDPIPPSGGSFSAANQAERTIVSRVLKAMRPVPVPRQMASVDYNEIDRLALVLAKLGKEKPPLVAAATVSEIQSDDEGFGTMDVPPLVRTLSTTRIYSSPQPIPTAPNARR
jgi:hypothetical protein